MQASIKGDTVPNQPLGVWDIPSDRDRRAAEADEDEAAIPVTIPGPAKLPGITEMPGEKPEEEEKTDQPTTDESATTGRKPADTPAGEDSPPSPKP